MSTSNCEIGSTSQRSSGGDFQCTEEELFESFMEIINNQDLQCSDNLSEGTSLHEADEDTNGNNNIDSDDSEKTEVKTINNGCLDNELDSKEIVIEPQEGTISTSNATQSDESLNCASQDTSIVHDDRLSQSNVSLNQNEHEEHKKDDFDQRSLAQEKDDKSDNAIIPEEKKDSSDNQNGLSGTSKDLNHCLGTSTVKTAGENLDAVNEMTGALCEGENNFGQSKDQKSSAEMINDATLKNELPEEPNDKNELHIIEEGIEEGIRMANQVCDEIQEILIKRMSCSSDEILNDKDLDSPEIVKATIAETEPVEAATQQGADVDSSDDQDRNKTDNQIHGFVEISQHSNSSSTCSSLQEGSDDDVIERKNTSDSLDSSDGSLSCETKNKGIINWDVLNTAFGNPDTDEDDKEIYQSSGSFGGFGLMLDDDNTDKLGDEADNRKRSVSQCSTISESEFQEEYKKQHSTASLNSKKDGVLYSGYLLKLGGTGIIPKNWRKRWCVLRQDQCLYYYKTAKDNVPCGIVVLANYIVSRSSEFHKKNCLKLSKGGGRTYIFCAESPDDMLRWMDVLRKAANVIAEGTNFEIRQEIIHNVAIPALSIKNPDCHGYMTKQGAGKRSSWKRRYFVLKNGCLFYYRDMADTTALGVAKLHGYKLEEVTFSAKRSGFRAVPPSSGMRTFSFVADNEYDKKRWIPCLEQSIQSSSNSS